MQIREGERKEETLEDNYQRYRDKYVSSRRCWSNRGPLLRSCDHPWWVWCLPSCRTSIHNCRWYYDTCLGMARVRHVGSIRSHLWQMTKELCESICSNDKLQWRWREKCFVTFRSVVLPSLKFPYETFQSTFSVDFPWLGFERIILMVCVPVAMLPCPN